MDAFCNRVDQALGNGVTLVQLREKSAASREFYELALRVKKISDRHEVPLIINDRLDIAMAVDAAGLHVGQEDLPVAMARKLLGPKKILGATAATVEDALAAEAAGADYIGSGAMYPTVTKPGKPVLPMEQLARIKMSVHIPVVAIGGISADNTGPVMRTGVDGVAVVTAIMTSIDPVAATRKLKEILLNYRR